MTTEERLEIIKNKAQSDANAKMLAANNEAKERELLCEKIRDMADRIADVLALANACESSGVAIPVDTYRREAGKPYGYEYEFIAEGIYHHVGLIKTWGAASKGEYKYVGIENGGACGCYDLWTDGNETFSVHEDNKTIRREPRNIDLRQFVREFPNFEKGFLNWVDSLGGDTNG